MGDQLPDSDEHVQQFLAEVNNNPSGWLATFNNLRVQAEGNTVSSSSPPPLPSVDPQVFSQSLAQALAQTLPQVAAALPQQQTPVDTTAITNAILAGLSPTLTQPTNYTSRPRSPPRSEKLPDIPEYDGDVDKLDAWEQSLIQRMDVNHDRYTTARAKIAYAESRLTIGKKAYNLMNPYRKEGLCTLTSFSDWRSKLRAACGNPFEQEDARNYIKELKQGSLPFEEYYNLFSQKKERSHMEDASLIDALNHNVNFQTQQASVSWRTPEGKIPSTFAEYVLMYSQIDNKLRQIRHRLPRQSSAPATTGAGTKNSNQKPTVTNSFARINSPMVVATTPVIPMPPGDPMDLSAAQAAVKGRKLSEPSVKAICDKWKLCYYCKLSHPGLVAKNCPNKQTQLRSGFITEFDDNQSIAGGVSLDAGKV